MSTVPEEQEEDGYEPAPVTLGEDEVLISDNTEFFAATQSLAAHLYEGVLWVLDNKTLRWRAVDQPVDSPPRKLTTVKK